MDSIDDQNIKAAVDVCIMSRMQPGLGWASRFDQTAWMLYQHVPTFVARGRKAPHLCKSLESMAISGSCSIGGPQKNHSLIIYSCLFIPIESEQTRVLDHVTQRELKMSPKCRVQLL